MINPFSIGDIKEYETFVSTDKLAEFDAGLVHPVYATFALAKDAEWVCRLFVLEMKEAGEEGIGLYVSVNHLAPAPLGSKVKFKATLQEVNGNKITCSYEVYRNENIIAHGEQIQKIINKAKFDSLIQNL